MRRPMISAGVLPGAVGRWLVRNSVPLTIGTLIALLLLLDAPMRERLTYDREALERGAVWTLLTHALVHLGSTHALFNLLGLAALLLLCPDPLPARTWVLRVLGLTAAVAVGLYLFVPTVDRYVGFSGTLHGLFVLGLLPQARRGDRIAWACLAYLAAKLLWEILAGAPAATAIAIGGRVVTEAHLLGTLAGLAWGVMAERFVVNGVRT